MDLSSAVDYWLEWLGKSKGRSSATVEKYRGYFKSYAVYLAEVELDWADADLSDLEAFSGAYLFKTGLKAKSRSIAIAALRNFYAWATRKELLDSDPADELGYPTLGRRLPRSMSLQDAETLINSIDLDEFSGVRDAAIISLFLGCAPRVSGLCGLNQSSLIFNKDEQGRERLYVRLVEKGAKERVVPAPMETMLLIRAYLGHKALNDIDRTLPSGDQVLFVSVRNRKVPQCDYIGEKRRISSRSINDMLTKHCKAAGIDEAMAHPHALRHLYGAELFESDVNVLTAKTLLGHENADTTEIYAHIAVRKLTAEVDRANPLSKIRTPVTDLLSQLDL